MKLLALAITANALRPLSTRLHAKRSEDDIGKQAKGFYIRPSAAIERGGGFFIPGLEGAKLRIALGGGLLVLSGLSIAASGDAPLARARVRVRRGLRERGRRPALRAARHRDGGRAGRVPGRRARRCRRRAGRTRRGPAAPCARPSRTRPSSRWLMVRVECSPSALRRRPPVRAPPRPRRCDGGTRRPSSTRWAAGTGPRPSYQMMANGLARRVRRAPGGRSRVGRGLVGGWRRRGAAGAGAGAAGAGAGAARRRAGTDRASSTR